MKKNEEILYREFGKNAELLIDHAWGHEYATMEDIKNYRSDDHGLYSGQVLMKPTAYEDGLKIVRGMSDNLALELVRKHVVTDRIGLIIDYDIKSLQIDNSFNGKLTTDYYGRKTPKPDHAFINLKAATSSATELRNTFKMLYEENINKQMLIRRVTLIANHLIDENLIAQKQQFKQINLFTNPEKEIIQDKHAQLKRQRDRKIQETILNLQKRFNNRNIILKVSDLEEGSTTIQRNNQIGGHHA